METLPTLRTEVQPGVWIDSRRALFLASTRSVVVADLHWGFSEAHRSAGNLVPLWGDEAIARTLWRVIDDYQPVEMIWLGDCLHRVSGRRAAERFLADAERRGLRVEVLAGNHDREWRVPRGRTLTRESYFLHHGDVAETVPPDAVEIVGHFHPAVSWSDGAGTRLKIPALVASAQRLILPAFSPWAAGVTWNHHLLPGETLWAVAPSRIFAVRGAQPSLRTAPSR